MKTHRNLHIQVGDQVEVNGAIGTVTAVNLKWDEGGHYGNRASYRVSDGGGSVWVRDSQVTGVIHN
jgi:hypothetical protein